MSHEPQMSNVLQCANSLAATLNKLQDEGYLLTEIITALCVTHAKYLVQNFHDGNSVFESAVEFGQESTTQFAMALAAELGGAL